MHDIMRARFKEFPPSCLIPQSLQLIQMAWPGRQTTAYLMKIKIPIFAHENFKELEKELISH